MFRPIPSHFIRICLSYYPPIPRLFPFDQSSSNAIAGDCIERLAFNGGNGTTREKPVRVGARRRSKINLYRILLALLYPDFLRTAKGRRRGAEKKKKRKPFVDITKETGLLVCLQDRFCFPRLFAKEDMAQVRLRENFCRAVCELFWSSIPVSSGDTIRR